jgi:hypothetical protein
MGFAIYIAYLTFSYIFAGLQSKRKNRIRAEIEARRNGTKKHTTEKGRTEHMIAERF